MIAAISRLVRSSFSAVLCLLCTQACQIAQSGEPAPVVGLRLFEHEWVPYDALSIAGDGLGPMYNAASCVACHRQGGIGGGGPGENNVELLSAAAPGQNPSDSKVREALAHAAEVHDGFRQGGASTLFHLFSTDRSYDEWRLSLLGARLPADVDATRKEIAMRRLAQKLSREAVATLPSKQGIMLKLSRRNTPALFGAGLIASVSEEVLLDLAKQQPKRFPDVSGRVGRTGNGDVGRFGWRGHVGTLREFVLTACAMELGLQNPDHRQAANPLVPHARQAGDDLSEEQCDALVAFVASLAPPRQLPAANPAQASRIQSGERLFESIGCAGCHVRKVGLVDGLFSDLLLHDMGPALEDPMPANPERRVIQAGNPGFAYGGGSFEIFEEVPTAIRREWRTPPLWGVRDSAPYLHDGRAATLEDAIAAHGGEAESSARRFQSLDNLGRASIVMFLQSLAAPEPWQPPQRR
jgi:CxxC motif-containing protein (DUF1111 family)